MCTCQICLKQTVHSAILVSEGIFVCACVRACEFVADMLRSKNGTDVAASQQEKKKVRSATRRATHMCGSPGCTCCGVHLFTVVIAVILGNVESACRSVENSLC